VTSWKRELHSHSYIWTAVNFGEKENAREHLFFEKLKEKKVGGRTPFPPKMGATGEGMGEESTLQLCIRD